MVILMSKKNKLWYGFLEAGSKSGPVAIDRGMETGDGKTLFIYNHNKKEILKYVRELVEPKLRELNAQEKALEASLKKGFTESLKTIGFKIPKALSIPEKEIPTPQKEPVPEMAELEMSGLDDGDDDDDDWKDTDD
jgi:hypothetical protein